jgi:cobalt-zinc-cadmium efflux system protein
MVAAIGLVVNIAGMLILRQGSQQSLNMKGAYFEVLSDMLTSIGVIVAAIIMLTTGWYYADPIISAGIGLFILPRTWVLLKDAVGVLLEGTPSDVNLAALKAALNLVPGVIAVHDLHVWSLTSGMNSMSAHVEVMENADVREVLTLIKTKLRDDFKIVHTTIQTEVAGFDEPKLNI